jgi:ABC-2 type transport system permease protein
MQYAGAIFWAHWRSMRNFYPRRGIAWTAVVGLGWYGVWAAAAVIFARIFSAPSDVPVLRAASPGGLLTMFLYWQVVPLLLATTGSSLDLRKLRAYPVPQGRLFGIEILLRVTSAIEMVLLLAGMIIGTLLNPALPKWGPLAVLFGLFNLILGVGLRDFFARQLARKRVAEVVVLLLVAGAALPQIVLARRALLGGPFRLLTLRDAWPGWPWIAAANLLLGERVALSVTVLCAWILLAYVFSSWQFGRSLRFDFDAARSGSANAPTSWRHAFGASLFRWPSWLLSDPLAAMVEKELRSLARSSRFRLIYIMGLVFGSLMPLMLARSGGSGGFFHRNYLTLVCVYALMLMSESCFWNVFGFDRSAAQLYFLAPVSFTRVLASKNVAAMFFLATQLMFLTAISVLLGMPFDAERLFEAFGAVAVVMILLFAAGNLLSVHQARGVNPAHSLRSGTAGRLQAMLFMVYPVTFVPLGFAYLARYAFESQTALYGILGLDIAIGLVLYKLSLDSAAQAAERTRENMVAALSAGDGPIAD